MEKKFSVSPVVSQLQTGSPLPSFQEPFANFRNPKKTQNIKLLKISNFSKRLILRKKLNSFLLLITQTRAMAFLGAMQPSVHALLGKISALSKFSMYFYENAKSIRILSISSNTKVKTQKTFLDLKNRQKNNYFRRIWKNVTQILVCDRYNFS